MSYPKVLTYHPEIGVRDRQGRIRVIRVDLPDFAMNDEVLGIIGEALQVRTAGEIVERLSARCPIEKSALRNRGFLGVVVDNHTHHLDDSNIVDWDYAVSIEET